MERTCWKSSAGRSIVLSLLSSATLDESNKGLQHQGTSENPREVGQSRREKRHLNYNRNSSIQTNREAKGDGKAMDKLSQEHKHQGGRGIIPLGISGRTEVSMRTGRLSRLLRNISQW